MPVGGLLEDIESAYNAAKSVVAPKPKPAPIPWWVWVGAAYLLFARKR